MTDDVTPGPIEEPDARLKDEGYYYNLSTGEVEKGQRSVWTKRIGPYATREAAEHALATAQRRTEAWDEEDRRWREGD
ncbi:sporulation related protein [Salana multivorans]|uniref:Sporulation related protein n=1 Tax=Salana multivorans TaxID=120377 RepID=A0A3N2D1T8_9MICO|nr:SPOR domain-containing protein [Salana multivorans]MBN8883649.1 SPOR domain-containing protein [Salana multivorans]OJX93383.1 MAG: hypothetical protein BGO96_10455 [Micrococcales bacterium 73-15]ROR93750.1 sporulation related protein [Salana multivorans]